MATPLRKPTPEELLAPTQREERLPLNTQAKQAFTLLRILFVAIPLIAGIDKFTDLTTNWDNYVAPQIYGAIGLSAHGFMQICGIIEIIAGLGVAVAPRLFGYIVSFWMAGIVLNLLILGNYYDIALRDFGLCGAAFALGRLGSQFEPVPRRRLQALQ